MNQPKVCWFIESLMFGDEYDNGMKAALEKSGSPFQVISPMDATIRWPREFLESGLVLFHGSIQTHENDLSKSDYVFCPGAIANFENFKYSKLATHWGHQMLNKAPIFTTIGLLLASPHSYFDLSGQAEENGYCPPNSTIFIRPDDGRKSFGGQTLLLQDLEKFACRLNHETLVAVSSPRAISQEWRVLIADGKAVTGCQYRKDGKFDMDRQLPLQVEDLATRIANHAWQPDSAYMLDIGLVNGELFVIEANTFSCSDLYVMDYEKVVNAMNAVVDRMGKEQGLE